MLTAAQRDLDPTLDLILNAGYYGLDDENGYKGYHRAFYDTTSELNASVALNFSCPLGNHTASGILLQRHSEYNQTHIRILDLKRNIFSEVAVALQALSNAIHELETAARAVTSYEAAVENEVMKLKMGMSTAFKLVDLEDRRQNALLTELSARQRYADALIQLRLATGSLVAWYGQDKVEVHNRFSQLPGPLDP